VYYVMAALGFAGACVIWLGRKHVSEKLRDVA
jgi:hypothetical protein